ncbi:nuclear transport factor 2 family protein [Parvibaculum lavamentivorans]|nr:nuclear transport factor 2 family protein [Parvibaculum lavamentivorans]
MAQETLTTVQDDRSDISQVIYRWGFYRDHGMWDELLDTFHPDGDIQVTWYVGKFSGFVEASIRMAEGGAASSHIMRPPIVDVVGDRAISITPVSIAVRANPGVEIDLTSNAYFFDFLERKSGVWKVSRRIRVYQKDRMDNVYPSIKFWLMSWFIDRSKFDPAYRFLGAALEAQGFPVQPGQIVDNTAESRALYAEGRCGCRLATNLRYREIAT